LSNPANRETDTCESIYLLGGGNKLLLKLTIWVRWSPDDKKHYKMFNSAVKIQILLGYEWKK